MGRHGGAVTVRAAGLFRAAAVMAGCLAPALLAAATPAELLGAWRGTSTCVDKTNYPACRDETVAYEVREKPGDPSAVVLDARKVVGGELQPMGELEFRFDADRGAWTSEIRNGRVHALWIFVVRGGAIEGTLVDLPDGRKIRDVAVHRP